MAKRKKRFSEMTTAELREATKKYDREFIADSARPLNKRDRAKFKLAAETARRMGRPRVGEGAQRVLITMERGLLGQVDDYAKRHKVSRSELIAAGVRMAMGGRS